MKKTHSSLLHFCGEVTRKGYQDKPISDFLTLILAYPNTFVKGNFPIQQGIPSQRESSNQQALTFALCIGYGNSVQYSEQSFHPEELAFSYFF